MTPEMLLARVAGQSIALSEPVGGARPEWTVVECGWGCNGLDEPYHLAIRYRHARDQSVYWKLRGYLRREAERLSWREKWKRKVAGLPYLDQIVGWVMLEEMLSLVDRQRMIFQLLAMFPDGQYERDLAPKQRAVAVILDRWCSIAHEHVARRIADQEPDENMEIVDMAFV